MLDGSRREQKDLQCIEHPQILLYAEYLPNIRTLSIQATLPTPSNGETKAYISEAADILHLEHEDEHAVVQLPSYTGHGATSLALPVNPSTELNFRLSIEDKSDNGGSDDASYVPWMAQGLNSDAELSCAACQATFVPRGTVLIWKDLPSEGWAEMMDFWHCHKPDEPHHHDTHASGNAGRGFASNSRLAVSSSVGLVGHIDLLLASDDCYSVEVSAALPLTFSPSHTSK